MDNRVHIQREKKMTPANVMINSFAVLAENEELDMSPYDRFEWRAADPERRTAYDMDPSILVIREED